MPSIFLLLTARVKALEAEIRWSACTPGDEERRRLTLGEGP